MLPTGLEISETPTKRQVLRGALDHNNTNGVFAMQIYYHLINESAKSVCEDNLDISLCSKTLQKCFNSEDFLLLLEYNFIKIPTWISAQCVFYKTTFSR